MVFRKRNKLAIRDGRKNVQKTSRKNVEKNEIENELKTCKFRFIVYWDDVTPWSKYILESTC